MSSNIVEALKKHLAETPKEQLDKEWEELKKWNDVGPTVDEYISSIKHNAQMKVDFCKEEINRLELTGQWTKHKEYWRDLKKNFDYWTKFLNEM